MISIGKKTIFYHSSCGTFNNVLDRISLTLRSDKENSVNRFLIGLPASKTVYLNVNYVDAEGFIACFNGLGNVYVNFPHADSGMEVLDTVILDYEEEMLEESGGSYDSGSEAEPIFGDV